MHCGVHLASRLFMSVFLKQKQVVCMLKSLPNRSSIEMASEKISNSWMSSRALKICQTYVTASQVSNAACLSRSGRLPLSCLPQNAGGRRHTAKCNRLGKQVQHHPVFGHLEARKRLATRARTRPQARAPAPLLRLLSAPVVPRARKTGRPPAVAVPLRRHNGSARSSRNLLLAKTASAR